MSDHIANLFGYRRPDWHRYAACNTTRRPDDWFPDRAGTAKHAVARAKAICAVCTVTGACLEYALVNCETSGVWGGKTPKERRGLRAAGVEDGTLIRVRVNVAACGTPSGFKKHRRDGTDVCEACRIAFNNDAAARRRRSRADGKAAAA